MNRLSIIKFSIITIITLYLGILTGCSIKDSDSDFIIKNGVLVEYVGNGGSVTIPKNVTTIGYAAFERCNTITSIVIPKSVTTIEKRAFSNCKNVNEIVIPNSVTSIGPSAFDNCKNLTDITIPESLTIIENSLFSNCEKLTKIIIPNSVTTIEYMAFWNCENLKDIIIPSSITNIGKDAFVLTSWLEEKQMENPLVIINGILVNGQACKGAVTIPKSVTRIGDRAFSGGRDLISVDIPSSVTEIGTGAFWECRNLETVKMTDSVKSLGNGFAFCRCTKLKNITLSNSLTTIPDNTFEECKSLTKITIPQSVKTISELAFRYCRKLKYVTISNNVTKIYYGAFDECKDNLTFYGFSKSFAEEYAKEKINFKTIKLNKSEATIAVGDSTDIKLNGYGTAKWESSNNSIATVNSIGTVTGKKKGTVTITASLYGKTYKCSITIK